MTIKSYHKHFNYSFYHLRMRLVMRTKMKFLGQGFQESEHKQDKHIDRQTHSYTDRHDRRKYNFTISRSIFVLVDTKFTALYSNVIRINNMTY